MPTKGGCSADAPGDGILGGLAFAFWHCLPLCCLLIQLQAWELLNPNLSSIRSQLRDVNSIPRFGFGLITAISFRSILLRMLPSVLCWIFITSERWKPPIPFDDEPPGGVEPKKWRKKVKEAGAFGKHARSDHDRAYEYNHVFMEAYLVCAVAAHSRLKRPTPDCLRFIFWLWFDFQYPHLVERLPVAFESRNVEQLKKISRTKFLQIFGPQFVGNPPRPDQ